MPAVEVPDFGLVDFPEEMNADQIGTAIRESIYKLPALPPMPEYDQNTYRDRRFISENNLKSAVQDFDTKALAFDKMATAVKEGKATTDEATVEQTAKALKLAKTRHEMALDDWKTVQRDPAPFGASFQASTARGALNTAAAAVKLREEMTDPGLMTGKPFDAKDQQRYDQLVTELDREDLAEAMSQEGGGAKLPGPRRDSLLKAIKELERPPRATTTEGQLAGAAAQSFQNADINPDAKNVGAQIGRGAGNVAAMAPPFLLGGASLPLAVLQMGGITYEQAYTQKEQELRTQGVPDSAIHEAAQDFATKKTVVAAPEFAAYMVGGKLAGEVVGKILPEGSKALRGFAGAAAATGANVLVGGTLRKFHGEDFLPTVEQLTQDILFSIKPGIDEARKTPTPREEAPAAPVEEASVPPVEPPRGSSVQNIVPAIRVGEQVVKGQPGETHRDVIQRFADENPERAADAWENFETKENPNFFVGPDDVPISRAELQQRFGVPDAQGLRELQAAEPQRNLGPGAANIEEFGTPTTVGAKNASVDAQRAERGLPPLMSEARKAHETSWENMEQKVEADPEHPARLVNEIESGERKSIADEDQAALLHRMIDLRNQRDIADQRALDMHTYTAEERKGYEDQAASLERELQRTEEADRKIGTASGRALEIRKLMAREDFTLAAMERRMRQSKSEALTPEERTTIRREAEEIQKTQEGFDKREQEVDAENSVAAAREALAKAARIHPKVLDYAEGVVSRWEAEAVKARQDIREAMGLASANPLQFKVAAAAFKIARAKIARGLLNASEFVTDLVREFGEGIRTTAQKAWDKAFKSVNSLDASKVRKKSAKQLEREGKAAEEAVSTEDGIKAVLAGGETDLGKLTPYIQKLGNEYARAGHTVEGVEAKLFEIFKDAVPGVTPRQLRDAWSNYGKSKAATTDPQKIAQAQRRTEAQKLSALDDLMAKRAALATGQQRVGMSDRARALTKQINEKKKELGIVDGDPAARLKSTLESMETRVRNRINDLRFEIAKGERTIKTKGAQPTSPKLEELRKELATVEAEHEAVFGKRQVTPEQRLKAAISSAKRAEEVAMAELSAARKGIFTKPAQKGVTRSTELDAIRARTTAAREERKALEDAANPPMSQAQKRLDAALVARERWEQALAGELAPGKKMSHEALTQLEEDARAEIAAMRDLAAEMKREDRAPDEASKAQDALNRALAEKERIEGILSGEVAPKKGEPREALTQMEEDVRLEIQSLRRVLAEQNAKPKADPQVAKENAQVKALEKAAEEYERRLNDADFSGRGKKLGPDTARVAAARVLRDAARKAFDAAKDAATPKRTPEEVAIQAFKARVAARNAELADRIAKGDFDKRTRKEKDISKDPEAVRLKAENERLKKNFEKARFDEEQRQRSTLRKGIDVVKETLAASRSLITSADVSAPLRQGGFLLIGDLFFHPIRVAKQLGTMFRQLASEKNFDKAQAAIGLRPNADLYQASKLYFSDMNGKLSAREENMRSSLAEQIPVIGRIVRASNRAYSGFLNRQRADAFDAMVESRGGAGAVTPEGAKLIAEAVNTLTGRGSIGAKNEGAANFLARYLFSPRFLASRFQTVLGKPILGALGKGASARDRAVIAKQYVKFAVGISAIYGLALLAGGKVEKDPRSADFGKIRIGDTRIDPLAGLAQVTTLMARTSTGETKTEGAIKPVTADTYYRFARSKLAPIPGSLLDIRTGKNIVGEKVTPSSTAVGLTVPISYQDIGKIYKDQGGLKGTVINVLNLLGAGVQTYRK